jgi:hypothetical protein
MKHRQRRSSEVLGHRVVIDDGQFYPNQTLFCLGPHQTLVKDEYFTQKSSSIESELQFTFPFFHLWAGCYCRGGFFYWVYLPLSLVDMLQATYGGFGT